MNLETAQLLQSWIDGELDPAESRRAANLVETNVEARALADHLRALSTTLRELEPARSLPVSGDFFWSQIRRGIEGPDQPAPQAAHQPPPSWSPLRWLAWLVPAGACAVGALFFLRPDPPSPPPMATARVQPPQMVGHQIETLPTGMTSLTFYSAEDAMTVVWLGEVDLF